MNSTTEGRLHNCSVGQIDGLARGFAAENPQQAMHDRLRAAGYG